MIGEDPEIKLLEWYIKETEHQIADMRAVERQYIADQVLTGDSEPNGSGVVAIEYYACRARYSHIIQMASLLETCLKRACEKLTQILGGDDAIPFTARHLKGDQWSVKRIFLEQYGRFKVTPEVSEPVRSLLFVRNVIVHHNGETTSVSDDEAHRLKQIPNISVESGKIELESKYLADALTRVRAYIRFIDNALRDVAARALAPQSVR